MISNQCFDAILLHQAQLQDQMTSHTVFHCRYIVDFDKTQIFQMIDCRRNSPTQFQTCNPPPPSSEIDNTLFLTA